MRNRICTALALVVVLSGVAAHAKSYRAERYDVDIQLDQSGGMEVTETVVFRFGGDSFTYVFRDIAATETDGIADVRAWMDGNLCTAGTAPGQVEVSGERTVKVRWSFHPLSNQTHTFTLKYRALGAIRREESADKLIWRALPPNRGYRIDLSEVTVHYPEGARLRNAGIQGKRAAIFFGSGSVTARMSGLDREARAVIRAEFAPGGLAGGRPRWQVRKDERGREIVAGLRVGALAGAPLLALALLLLYRLRGSDWSPPAIDAQAPVTQPPGAMAPALAAALTRSPHGSTGMLLDFAKRGVIRIEEVEKAIFGTRDFRILRGAVAVPPAGYEDQFLRTLFPGGEVETRMSKAVARITRKWPRVSAAISRQLVAAGWVDVEKQKRRKMLLVSGAILLLAALAMLGAGAIVMQSGRPYESGLLLMGGAALCVSAVFALVMGGQVAPWSSAGAATRAQWLRFRSHLKDLSRGGAPMPPAEALERYLPYAAAFGLAQALLKRQKKEGRIALPVWFSALSRSDGADSSAFIAFMGSADAGSGAGAAASAAGASGGGSSGAG